MTILEKKKRKEVAKKGHFSKTPAKSPKAPPGISMDGVLPHVARSVFSFLSNSREQQAHERPLIAPHTERLMHKLVAEMISNCEQGSVSLTRVVCALELYTKLADAHGNGRTDKGESTMLQKLRKLGPNPNNTMRRYQLKNAFTRVKGNSANAANDTIISEWEHVKEFLSQEMDFESDVSPSETALIETTPSSSFFVRPSPIPFRLDDSEPTRSYVKFRQILGYRVPKKISEDKDAIAQELKIEMAIREEKERKDREELEEVQRRQEEKEKEEEAQRMASSVLRDLTNEEEQIVEEAMYGRGPGNQVLNQEGSDSVTRASMATLRPGQWLNDEVIVFFYLMLAKRDEALCRLDPNRKRCHFFNSFFITKLLNEGHAEMNGIYQYSNVKRWSKKVPGKDIFKLDKIFFPINENRMHWVCAVAFMQEKRIQFYDSMGSDGKHYLDSIFQYIQDEHKDKKKSPLPDIDEWQLVTCTEDTPRQANGFDCGVFTCCFADFIANDCPLVFTQKHVNKCRKRIALSIMRGQAII